MIEIKNLHKFFNKHKKNQLHVINDVSLKLPNKGLVALLGPSGSGKTTMLNLIGGLDKQSKGKILINDQKLSKNFSLKRDYIRTLNIGYIFQDYKLIDEDSVFDNVALSLKLLGIKNKKEIKRRVEFILDKVGMFRYRYRPAGMLSGGERQRVGIARALVKDPDIILADEPTGNLDSKNTLDVMNIITQIAKDKLVILVTHEQNLAKFYADRVIEFNDGVIKNDYKNDHPDELDYQIENKFYLKDFKHKNNLNNKNINVNVYSNDNTEVNIDIVVKNGNYYIKTYNSNISQLVDDDSSIEFVDEHYKKISKSELENTSFDAEDIKKKKYCSIFNIFTFFGKGFQKVFNYSLFKKLLLGGFVISGAFILYAFASIKGAITVKDDQFITTSKDYINIKTDKVKVKTFNEIAKLDESVLLIPGDSAISMNISPNNIFQFTNVDLSINGSLVPLESVKESDLLYGRMPQNNYEIVIDKLLIERNLNQLDDYKMIGLTNPEDFINLHMTIYGLEDFIIVGVANKVEPCIYINKDMINPLLSSIKAIESEQPILNYSLYSNSFRIVKGRAPVNDYEIIVNNDQRYEKPLNKTIDQKINGKKLLVVGYYKPIEETSAYYSNDKTSLYNYIPNTKNIAVYKGKKSLYQANGYPAVDVYSLARDTYIKGNKESVKSKIFVSIVIITISLVEVFLISRSSFLSKIKEVGTYRAIGVKKFDICKMFMGEAFAITTLASLPGIALSTYIVDKLSKVKYFKYSFIVDFKVVILSIITVYVFNILVSLIPVINLIRKTPANILSRNDVD